MDDKKSILVEKIKNVIIALVHYANEIPKINYSEYITEKLGYDYTYLSNQFKKVTGHSPSFYKKIGLKRKGNLESL